MSSFCNFCSVFFTTSRIVPLDERSAPPLLPVANATDWFYALVSALIQLRHPVQSPSTRWRFIYSHANNPSILFRPRACHSLSSNSLILVFAICVTRMTCVRPYRFSRMIPPDRTSSICFFTQFHASSNF